MAENIPQQYPKCAYCGGQIRPEIYGETVFFCCPFGCSIVKNSKEPSCDMAEDDFHLLLNMGLPLN